MIINGKAGLVIIQPRMAHWSSRNTAASLAWKTVEEGATPQGILNYQVTDTRPQCISTKDESGHCIASHLRRASAILYSDMEQKDKGTWE